MGRLIRDHLLVSLKNDRLSPLTDGAILPQPAGDLVFTTDSYVVTPLEFPGGDIGRLAVAGTVNDLAVMGADPIALSLGLILEEGLSLELLDRIVASIAATAREAGVEIVTGDTKVIERRSTVGSDGLFINTSGVGRMRPGVQPAMNRIQPGDAILLNGTIADHGLTVMSRRHGIEFETELRTDAAPLNQLLSRLFDSRLEIHFVRDATRGGIAGVLADISEQTALGVEIDERRIPISPTARHAAEMLGLDPLTVANEGKIVCVVSATDAENAVEIMRSHPFGVAAAMIGKVTSMRAPWVELLTSAGGRRVVQRPYGEDLPRIC